MGLDLAIRPILLNNSLVIFVDKHGCTTSSPPPFNTAVLKTPDEKAET